MTCKKLKSYITPVILAVAILMTGATHMAFAKDPPKNSVTTAPPIPKANDLIEKTLLPEFRAELFMQAKSWHLAGWENMKQQKAYVDAQQQNDKKNKSTASKATLAKHIAKTKQKAVKAIAPKTQITRTSPKTSRVVLEGVHRASPNR